MLSNSLPRLMVFIMACLAVGVVVGTSCPPPSNPVIFSVVPDDDSLSMSPLPPCIDGFVCVNLTNEARVPVIMALYRHDGFDTANDFPDPPSFECCTIPNSTVACPCFCVGASDGECCLDRREIFLEVNRDPVAAMNEVMLTPGNAILKRIRCEDVKTLGAAVALVGVDVATMAADRNGPVWRNRPNGFTCGGTIQFTATDLNESMDPALASLIIVTDIAQ